MSAWTNDGSDAPPRLRQDLNIGTLWNLPKSSIGWAEDEASQFEIAKDLGFEAIQHWYPKRVLAAGLRATGMGRAVSPSEIEPIVAAHKALGLDATTFHLGTGFETDAQIDALIMALLAAGQQQAYPVFLETHRATITQDMRRTLDMVERFTDIRFNADLSHWYTGAEMTYGDFDAKLVALAPVFERVGFMHGRIGDSGSIQTRLDLDGPYLDHHKAMWTACFVGFLKSAKAGDYLSFNPELLPRSLTLGPTTHWMNYAQTGPDGAEQSDRVADALALWDVAQSCFEAAQRVVAT
jgi:hypothetical protein